jgi:RNA polymerase sigma factor (sigma-70 family)
VSPSNIFGVVGSPRGNDEYSNSKIEPVLSGADMPEAVEAQRLLALIRDGDFTSFFSLWKSCEPSLYRICLKHLGGRRADAEDALSRAMLIAWERLPQHVHAIRDIRAWLTRLTINLCIDILRERKRYAAVFEALDEVYNLSHEHKDSSENPEELALRNELSLYLSYSINDLPPKLRKPFLLRFIQEMSYVDISAQLNLSSDNIRKRIQQARTLLRNKLATYLIDRKWDRAVSIVKRRGQKRPQKARNV